jgi:hypothetical protein
MRMFLLFLSLLVLASASSRGADEATDKEGALPCLQAAFSTLAARGISIDSNAACRAAALAVARSSDPRAELKDLSLQSREPTGSVEKAEAWAEDVRYLKLRWLAADTATNVEQQVGAWLHEKCSGLILDLRDSGGDNLAAADRLAAFFSGATGALYTVEHLDGRTESHAASPVEGWHAAAPLLVMIDRRTRDASELLASLLRGRSGILLVGASTLGDAGVREIIPWSGQDGLWIVTGRITLPQGPAYAPDGLAPDVHVEESAANAPRDTLPKESVSGRPFSARANDNRALMLRTSGDAALRRATEILLALRAVRGDAK